MTVSPCSVYTCNMSWKLENQALEPVWETSMNVGKPTQDVLSKRRNTGTCMHFETKNLEILTLRRLATVAFLPRKD